MTRETAETPKTETQTETRPVTFSLEDPALQQIIAQAVVVALAKQKAEAVAIMSAVSNGRSERSMQNEIAVVKAFKKAGFGNVTPHVDVMTFNRWLSKGFRPMEGSKSLKIKNLRLFHRTQVRHLTVEEKTAMQEQSDAAVARHTASVVQLNPQ
jgi:hypothetical protein